MANTYMVGNQIKLQGTFTVGGVATDPTTITARVRSPDGVVTVYTYAGASVTKSATGIYYLNVTMSEAGTWWVRWEGTGTALATEEESITISTSNVI